MLILKGLLIFVEIISSILLIVVVLLQRSKSEGLGLAFGSQMGESLFGARAGNVLVKATMWLGIIFVVNTTVLAKIYSNASSQPLVSASSSPAPIPVPRPLAPNQSPAPSAPMASPMTPAAPSAPASAMPFSMPEATPASAPAP